MVVDKLAYLYTLDKHSLFPLSSVCLIIIIRLIVCSLRRIILKICSCGHLVIYQKNITLELVRTARIVYYISISKTAELTKEIKMQLTETEIDGLKAMEKFGLFTAPDPDSPNGRITLLHILDYFQDIKKPTRNEIKRFIRDYSNII